LLLLLGGEPRAACAEGRGRGRRAGGGTEAFSGHRVKPLLTITAGQGRTLAFLSGIHHCD